MKTKLIWKRRWQRVPVEIRQRWESRNLCSQIIGFHHLKRVLMYAWKPMSAQLWRSRSAAGRHSRCAPAWKRLTRTLSPSTSLYIHLGSRVSLLFSICLAWSASSESREKSEHTIAHARITLHLCLWVHVFIVCSKTLCTDKAVLIVTFTFVAV